MAAKKSSKTTKTVKSAKAKAHGLEGTYEGDGGSQRAEGREGHVEEKQSRVCQRQDQDAQGPRRRRQGAGGSRRADERQGDDRRHGDEGILGEPWRPDASRNSLRCDRKGDKCEGQGVTVHEDRAR